MYTILNREELNSNVTRIRVLAPYIAKNSKPGQFVILRNDKDGERIPLTISNSSKEDGWVEVIFQIVGAQTYKLNKLQIGDYLEDIVGPLGVASNLEGKNKVAIIGGGVGSAIALPVAKGFKDQGAQVHSIVGFRDKDLVILENEFKEFSDKYCLMTDDGSKGEKGLVTNALEKLITEGNQYDEVFAVGPIIMMKFVAELTKKYNIKTMVSMNPIMVDGTGMCGACRVKVGNETKFACVDGPDFDAHNVDYDLLMKRNTAYNAFEKDSMDRTKKEVI